MRVGDLIQTLLTCDQRARVYLATDEEGNDFFPVFEVSEDEDGDIILWP